MPVSSPILTASELRREISARNVLRAEKFHHELSASSSPSVIYCESDGSHGNFVPASWAAIVGNPSWHHRLAKAYTASRNVPRAADRRRFELECATSSDALLMNIFCYPRLLRRESLCRLLAIEAGLQPEFGVRPAIPLAAGRFDRTEIDMRLGDLLIEAKLTEADFQRAPLRLLSRYSQLEQVFDPERLPILNGVLHSWQLVRGVLAAHASSGRFAVFCDRRRADLIDRWFEVMQAVIDCSLRTRLCLLAWQEIGATLPAALRLFLAEKYGISS